jgi:peptidyl-prolyl cis-trans isomerase A (cyclophilin A)/peptidyl-prolyl cis-trans isomerase B (cyclophilin B)
MTKHLLLSLAFFVAAPLAFAQAPAKPAATKPAVVKPPAPAATAAKPATPAPGAVVKAVLHTSQGDITIELNAEKAPKSVENFVQYAKEGFYNGTVFHRVIPGFMIQGGGYASDFLEKKTRAPIRNEANNGLSNLKYTLSMARTPDPHSARAQFFINLVDNKRLDFTSDAGPSTWGYAVFGKVIKGTEVVDKIAAIPTGAAGPFSSDVPTTPVTIDKVDLLP